MAILIPNTIKANELLSIDVITLEIGAIYKESNNSTCNNWGLTKKDVAVFFKTAEIFSFSAQINDFNILYCEARGELMLNGVKRKYSINRGGSAFIYGFGSEQQGYGCWEGECLKYVDYIPYKEE